MGTYGPHKSHDPHESHESHESHGPHSWRMCRGGWADGLDRAEWASAQHWAGGGVRAGRSRAGHDRASRGGADFIESYRIWVIPEADLLGGSVGWETASRIINFVGRIVMWAYLSSEML
jgi:hypothetical protein